MEEEQNTTESVTKTTNKKSAQKGMIIGMSVLSVAAIAGIAFGVYGMVSQNQKISSLETDLANCAASSNTSTENITVTCPDGTSTKIVKNVITNEVAQNLVNPYLINLTGIGNMLDYDFNEDIKVLVASKNMNINSIIDVTPIENAQQTFDYLIPYDQLNDKYQEMFGNSKELEKRSYSFGHTDTLSYNEQSSLFEVEPFMGGGAGRGMFSVVKDAHYNGDNLEINIYHDSVSICDGTDDNYCLEIGGGIASTSIEDINIKDLINNFSDRIPVYKMTFTKNAGHYVLSDIQKQ